jgi:SSS family solute:Na+ symporter
MTGLGDVALLVGYALVVLGIGAALARRGNSSESYLLADRTLGTARVFASTFATFHGTGIVVTFASLGYLYGVGAVGLPVAAVVGYLPVALFAPRIKALSDRHEAITLPALLADSWRPRTRALAALVTGALFSAALAVNLLAAGTALRALLDVPLRAGVLGFGTVVVAYTLLGGFRAVVWTDVLQTALIVVGVLVVLPAAVLLEAGPHVLEELPPGHLDPLAFPAPILLVFLLSGVFTFFGSQDVLQRIYAAKDRETARRGQLLFTGSLAVVGPVAVALGVAGRALVPAAASDDVLYALSGDVVPAGVLALVLLGFLALANSDADSQLVTVAATITRDLLPPLGVHAGDAERSRVDRLAVVGVGTIAVGTATAVPDAVALLGGLATLLAVLGVAVVATLFWDRTTDRGAFASIAVGVLAAASVVTVTGSIRIAPVVGLGTALVTIALLSLAETWMPGVSWPASR